MGAEMSVVEKQRDKLEAELREVNNTLTAANTRLQNAREERFQFDEDNNEFLLLLKEKEEELSSTIVSYRAEADTCHAFVNFLEATWTFQSSYVYQKDKQVNEKLQNHEVYFVIATTTFLSAYQDQLPLAIANVRKLEESVKGFRKIVDPDEEFLQDIKLRENVEQEYLDAEAKLKTSKDHFYTTIDDPSRKGVEVIAELLEAIGKLKREFDAIKRPNLTIEMLTGGDNTPSKGSPQSRLAIVLGFPSGGLRFESWGDASGFTPVVRRFLRIGGLLFGVTKVVVTAGGAIAVLTDPPSTNLTPPLEKTPIEDALVDYYDCKIIYHERKSNVVADVLNRKIHEKPIKGKCIRIDVVFNLIQVIKRAQVYASHSAKD
ncbi:hypothetical protein LXL04_038426 [Taraxacum kok-saghyz]